ncbi:MAG: hypothetical protein RSE17_04105 [Bacilli bacterium]
MPALVELKNETVIKVAVKMVNDSGIDSINARSLAKSLGISTKPLYRMYKNMDEIKSEIYKEILHQYDEFITSRIDSKKALLTLSIAYVEFAQNYKNLFIFLFLSNNLKWKTFDEVLDEKWNQSTIINLVNKHNYSFEDAKSLFMNFWLYVNGLATLIATNEIKIEEQEILVRLVKMYKILTKKE